MEFSSSFYAVIVVILALGLVGMIGNIQLAVYYRKWLGQLSDLEVQPAYLDSFLSDSDLMGRQPRKNLVEDISAEYMHHRSKGIELINTQAIVEDKLHAQHLRLFGLIRLPVHVLESFVRQIPSWSVILGLLGTFSGLTIALFDMQGTLLTLGSGSGEEIMTVSAIVAAIASPFQGMSFAFLTSITGIGVSFMLHVLYSGLLSSIGLGPSFPQLKNQFLTKTEGFLDHQVQDLVQQNKPKDSLEKVMDRLVDKVKESFDQSVHKFGEKMVRLIGQLEKNSAGLENVLQQTGAFSDVFATGSEHLRAFAQVLEKHMRQAEDKEKQLATQVKSLSTTLTKLSQEFKQMSSKNEDSRQALQKVVERSDQYVEQMNRKSEESFKFLQSHIEDVQRRFQEMFEDERRQFQQQQDEWGFRYQEKNDQFSRAAESFGQAVQHLERQWTDGLERFKRDQSSHMNQMLDKVLNQGNGQHHSSDREWREVFRGLEHIEHTLERELQTQQRVQQDIQHILVNMFDWGRMQMEQPRHMESTSMEPRHRPTSQHPIVRDSR